MSLESGFGLTIEISRIARVYQIMTIETGVEENDSQPSWHLPGSFMIEPTHCMQVVAKVVHKISDVTLFTDCSFELASACCKRMASRM